MIGFLVGVVVGFSLGFLAGATWQALFAIPEFQARLHAAEDALDGMGENDEATPAEMAEWIAQADEFKPPRSRRVG